MCGEGRPEDSGFGVRVLAGRFSDAYLQRVDVGQNGYTIVIWRGRHVADPTELSQDEARTYFDEVLRVARAIEAHYRPIKMNFEMLGNALPHLHTHVVPRYLDDGAPGNPPRFMKQTEAEHGKLSEEAVQRDAAALRKLLAG